MTGDLKLHGSGIRHILNLNRQEIIGDQGLQLINCFFMKGIREISVPYKTNEFDKSKLNTKKIRSIYMESQKYK
jgi:hypothetical protein